MKITELNQKPDIDTNNKLKEAYLQVENLLSELRKKDLPDELVMSINKDIEELNSTPGSEVNMRKKVKKVQARIIELLEKEVKLVPKNYYRNLWTALGMTLFGIPIGVALGLSLGNLALLGLGLPIGLGIGLAIGVGMDKKAFEEGRQLNVEMKY